ELFCLFVVILFNNLRLQLVIHIHNRCGAYGNNYFAYLQHKRRNHFSLELLVILPKIISAFQNGSVS
ncbi:MAG: hypothetical protein ACE5NG_03675, partial [bacterium]